MLYAAEGQFWGAVTGPGGCRRRPQPGQFAPPAEAGRSPLGLEAFNVEVGDIVEFDNARYGFSGKEFEVIGWEFSSNQQAGDLRVKLTLQETSQAAFNWNAEESDIINNNTNLPSPGAGLAINNLSASGGGRTQGDGTFINSAILDWDAVTNAFNAYYEIEWKALSDSNYSSTTTVESSIEITPLVDGVEYIFRVRAITAAGFKGSYSTVQFTGGGDVTAPGILKKCHTKAIYTYQRASLSVVLLSCVVRMSD